MTNAPHKLVENAIKNPEKIYQEPREVLEDSNLSAEQKEKILANWRSDQNALLRADNENMAEQDDVNHPDPAAMIAKIEKAQRSLQES